MKTLQAQALPKQKPPTRQQVISWANDVRLMVEQDKRTLAEITLVMRWAYNDPFWKSNILSMGKLRKQFGQLWERMAEKGASGNSGPRPKPICGRCHKPIPEAESARPPCSDGELGRVCRGCFALCCEEYEERQRDAGLSATS